MLVRHLNLGSGGALREEKKTQTLFSLKFRSWQRLRLPSPQTDGWSSDCAFPVARET